MASKKIISFFFFLLLFPTLGLADQNQVFKTTLDNGLTVLIQEMPLSTQTSIDICVKTGSAMEDKYMGKGISHYVEHMLFKGTAKRPVGSIPKEVKSLGGNINAYTSLDYTMYTLDVPSDSFKPALDIISDMVMNSTFDPVEMEKERKVIHGEMRLYNDRPDRVLSDMVFKNVYKQHPYKHPSIGYPVLFDTITHDELYSYYKERYIPNNMIISIAGAVNQSEILPLIKEMFKDFKPASYIQRNVPQEPPQTFGRILEKEYTTPVIHFSFAYEGVSVSDPDLYALDVLSMVLGQGETSRFYKEIYKQRHLVDDIGASNFTPQDRGIFEILGSMSSDHLDEVESLTKKIILDVQKNGLTLAELERTKRQVLTSFIFANQTSPSLASRAAVDEALTADANFSRHYVDQIKSVTNEDIKRVARQYLQDSRLNISILKPKADVKQDENSKTDIKEQGIKKIVLDNGLTILLHENHNTLIGSLRLTVHGGFRIEDPALAGIAQITGSVWGKATEHLNEDQLSALVESKGESFSAGSSYDTMSFNMDVLSEDLDFALDLMEDLVKNPTMPKDAIDRTKHDMIVGIDSRQDDIKEFSSRVLMETLFQTHPIRRDSLGTKETLNKITRKDVLDFYHRLMLPNNMTIAVFGDFDSNKMLGILKKKYGSFKKGDYKDPVFKEGPPTSTRLKDLQMDKEQALLLMGFQAPDLKEQDRFGMQVINAILGAGLSGRLFTKIREELGQAYTANSWYNSEIDAGVFGLYVLTKPDKVDNVKEIVVGQLESLKTQEVSAEELQLAKSYLKGGLRRTLDTEASLASIAIQYEAIGLGYDFYKQFNAKIDEVTAEDVKRIANTYLDISKAAIVITKPKSTEFKK